MVRISGIPDPERFYLLITCIIAKKYIEARKKKTRKRFRSVLLMFE